MVLNLCAVTHFGIPDLTMNGYADSVVCVVLSPECSTAVTVESLLKGLVALSDDCTESVCMVSVGTFNTEACGPDMSSVIPACDAGVGASSWGSWVALDPEHEP